MSKREFMRKMQHFAVDTWGLQEYFPEVPQAKIQPDARAPGDSLDLASVDEAFPDIPPARIIPDEHGAVGPEINPRRREAPRHTQGGEVT